MATLLPGRQVGWDILVVFAEAFGCQSGKFGLLV